MKETSDKSNERRSVVTPIARQVREIKIKMLELVEELSSFFKLIILTLVESCYLYIVATLHEPIDHYVEHSRLCPMKIAVLIIGGSFLFLNIVIVLGFVAIQTLATIRVVKSAFTKERGKTRNGASADRGKENHPRSIIVTGAGNANATITITVTRASHGIGTPPPQIVPPEAEKPSEVSYQTRDHL